VGRAVTAVVMSGRTIGVWDHQEQRSLSTEST